MNTLEEKEVSWEDFQKQFKSRYVSERYYDDRKKEFHESRLGQLTMDEFMTKFTNVLWYLPYIKEEEAQV